MYQESWWYDLQFLRYSVWQTENGNYGIFLSFYPSPLPLPQLKTKNSKNQKWKKLLEISSFCSFSQEPNADTSYDCGFWYTKTTIILDMVPEIRNKIDIIFCHFGPFLLFWSPNTLENQNFERTKKHLEMWSFYTCLPKITITWSVLPKIWSVTGIIFCFFFHFNPTS